MSEHYYTADPTSEIKEREYTQVIKGTRLTFKAVSGVFAYDTKVDRASHLLMENYIPTGNSVLDLGCGYGAIGLYIKAANLQLKVTLADINNRAVSYAKENAGINRLEVEVLQSDLYSSLPGRTFDDIVSNPPLAAGKKLNTQLIEEAMEHLSPGGSLWLVAFHNKGGATLKDIMSKTFGNVKDIEKSGGIRVYKSIRQG